MALTVAKNMADTLLGETHREYYGSCPVGPSHVRGFRFVGHINQDEMVFNPTVGAEPVKGLGVVLDATTTRGAFVPRLTVSHSTDPQSNETNGFRRCIVTMQRSATSLSFLGHLDSTESSSGYRLYPGVTLSAFYPGGLAQPAFQGVELSVIPRDPPTLAHDVVEAFAGPVAGMAGQLASKAATLATTAAAAAPSLSSSSSSSSISSISPSFSTALLSLALCVDRTPEAFGRGLVSYMGRVCGVTTHPLWFAAGLKFDLAHAPTRTRFGNGGYSLRAPSSSDRALSAFRTTLPNSVIGVGVGGMITKSHTHAFLALSFSPTTGEQTLELGAHIAVGARAAVRVSRSGYGEVRAGVGFHYS